MNAPPFSRRLILLSLLFTVSGIIRAQTGTPRTLDSLFGCAEIVALVEPVGDGPVSEYPYVPRLDKEVGRNPDDPIIRCIVRRSFKGGRVGDTLFIQHFRESSWNNSQFLVFLRRSRWRVRDKLRHDHHDATAWQAWLDSSSYRVLLQNYASVLDWKGWYFVVDYGVLPLPAQIPNTPMWDEALTCDYRGVATDSLESLLDTIAAKNPDCVTGPDPAAFATGRSRGYWDATMAVRYQLMPLDSLPPTLVSAAERFLRERVGDTFFRQFRIIAAVNDYFPREVNHEIWKNNDRTGYWIVIEFQSRDRGLQSYLTGMGLTREGALMWIDLPEIALHPWMVDSLISLSSAREVAVANGAPRVGLRSAFIWDQEFRSFAWMFSWWDDPDEEQGERWVEIDAYSPSLFDRSGE